MSETPTISAVEVGEDYVHVRYRDPEEFDEVRTPDWTQDAASSVVEGSEVRTGDRGGDDRLVQSVLVPREVVANEDEARDVADEIVARVRRRSVGPVR
jgi:hypothetical protein